MIPPLPESDGEGTGTAELRPRYEDITQDGRLVLTSMMQGIGASVWRAMSKQIAPEAFAKEGILPILRRLVIVGEGGPASVNLPVEYEGTWRFAREKGGDRIFLLMWMEARAPVASTYGPRPEKDAPRVRVGRIFAEHVVTKPFAPPAERKVTRLPDATGVAPVPRLEHAFETAEALVESASLESAGEVAFGMMHTDSNQHVNSLVYPRVFEEALVRRGIGAKLLSRAIEMRWRKPFFAGERAAIQIAMTSETSAVGTLSAPGESKPRCAIRMQLG